MRLTWSLGCVPPAFEPRPIFATKKISYKVREHSVAKVPALLAVGQREVEMDSVAVRRLGSKKQAVKSVDDAIAELTEEVLNRA